MPATPGGATDEEDVAVGVGEHVVLHLRVRAVGAVDTAVDAPGAAAVSRPSRSLIVRARCPVARA